MRTTLSHGPTGAFVDAFRRESEQVLEQAALQATDEASKRAVRDLRTRMRAAQLGRLGNAIGGNSDLSRGRGVNRTAGGFSASGNIHVRSRSERTLGAIEAYTSGAEIRPRRGRWLWIPTDAAQRFVGRGASRARVTPGLWRERGLDRKIGPLVEIRSARGTPLLVVQRVGVSALGAARSARALTKSGAPRKGQRLAETVIIFIGIARTSRAARIDPDQIARAEQAELPRLLEAQLHKRTKT